MIKRLLMAAICISAVVNAAEQTPFISEEDPEHINKYVDGIEYFRAN